jgi:hypothetical protein
VFAEKRVQLLEAWNLSYDSNSACPLCSPYVDLVSRRDNMTNQGL